MAEGLLFNPLNKVLGDLEVDVGFEQRATDLAQSIVNVALGNASLPAKRAEEVVKAFAESVKHEPMRRVVECDKRTKI